jgi:hypothetical protein
MPPPRIPRHVVAPPRDHIIRNEAIRNLEALSHVRELLGTTSAQGLTRDQLTAPMSPLPQLLDTLRYEDPKVAGKFYYLPRYRLETNNQQYSIQFSQRGADWILTVRLVPGVPVEVAAAGGGEPMAHTVAISLHYTVGLSTGGGAVQNKEFTEITKEGSIVVATMVFPSLEARDAAYLALCGSTPATSLTVHLTARIAIRVVVRLHHPRRPALPIEPSVHGDPPPATVRYEESDHQFNRDVDPRPFVFPPELHPYIYGSLTGVAPQSFELIRRAVVFEQKSYDYYQDPTDRRRFYYLPDSFKLLRRTDPPRSPAMVLQFSSGAGGLDDLIASMRYAAGPYIRSGRLEAAARELERYLPNGEETIVLEPLPAKDLRFSLALPGAGVSYQPRPDAIVEMSALSDLINLPFPQFRDVFDSMFSANALLFEGVINIGAQTSTTHAIPFSGRMGDLIGQVLESAHTPDPETGGATIALENVIESPVRVEKLEVQLSYGETLIAGTVADLTLPLEIPAGATFELKVAPAGAPPPDTEAVVILTLDGVKAVPNREAVLSSILQSEVAPEIQRAIKVKLPPAMFEAVPADPGAQLLVVLVHFESGTTIELTADAPAAEATVRTRLTSVLLENMDPQAYRYKLEIIRRGSRKRDQDWRTDTFGILYPDPS